MGSLWIFVGPYVECRSPEEIWPTEDGRQADWDDLLSGRKHLKWSMPGSNPLDIEVNGTQWCRYCGMPTELRDGIFRWPMMFDGEAVAFGEVFDWGAVEPMKEVEWFRTAYCEELALLRNFFPISCILLRWGLIYWRR
jgi:hypothetical protein